VELEREVRKMKHNLTATANALAVTVGFIYVACALLVAVMPGFFRTIAASWFHGWNMEVLWTGEPRAGSWVVGYVFAWTYNKFIK